MQAIMMVTALAWPAIGGALVGLIGGVVKGHGFVGTIVDIILGAVVGYLLTIAFMVLAGGAVPEQFGLALSLGLPVLGGFLALWLKGRFTTA